MFYPRTARSSPLLTSSSSISACRRSGELFSTVGCVVESFVCVGTAAALVVTAPIGVATTARHSMTADSFRHKSASLATLTGRRYMSSRIKSLIYSSGAVYRIRRHIKTHLLSERCFGRHEVEIDGGRVRSESRRHRAGGRPELCWADVPNHAAGSGWLGFAARRARGDATQSRRRSVSVSGCG